MLPMRDKRTTKTEDRATQPMEAGGWVSQKWQYEKTGVEDTNNKKKNEDCEQVKVFSRPMLSFQVSLEDVAFDDLVSSVSYKNCNIFDLRRISVLSRFLICQRVWKRDESIKWRITLFCTNFLQLLMKTHFDPHVKLLGINEKFHHCKELFMSVFESVCFPSRLQCYLPFPRQVSLRALSSLICLHWFVCLRRPGSCAALITRRKVAFTEHITTSPSDCFTFELFVVKAAGSFEEWRQFWLKDDKGRVCRKEQTL